MERIRSLDRYPKILLIALVVTALVFAPIYGIITSRVGFEHNNKIFVPRQENGVTLYEAQAGNQPCVFTVTDDTVTFAWGSKTYGPYTLREDPTAVPTEDSFAEYMTGIEILDGNKVYFRGGVTEEQTGFWLVSEDGSYPMTMIVTMSDGTEYDMNGSPVDHWEPTPHQIISLLRTPELTHKGQWPAYFMGVFVTLILAVSILFADELFYLSICTRVQNAETAEPSDWYVASRNIGWFLLTLLTGGFFLLGLQ